MRAVFTIETRASAVRYAFSRCSYRALTNNASGFVSDDDDANDKKNNNKNKNERRSTDDERGDRVRGRQFGGEFTTWRWVECVFGDERMRERGRYDDGEEGRRAKDVRSIRTGERVASTAPLVFFIGTTLAESGEKIVRICGERPEASIGDGVGIDV